MAAVLRCGAAVKSSCGRRMLIGRREIEASDDARNGVEISEMLASGAVKRNCVRSLAISDLRKILRR